MKKTRKTRKYNGLVPSGVRQKPFHFASAVVFSLLCGIMGSHGDCWLRCEECGRWGKCIWPEYLPADVPSLLDVDPVGPVYDGCLQQHAKLIVRWLTVKFGDAISQHLENYWHDATRFSSEHQTQ